MKRSIVLLLLTTACRPSTATAQGPPDPGPTTIKLRPAAEPIPALKYRLMPERSSLVPGNAAIFYHRGILFLSQTRARVNDPRYVNALAKDVNEEQISRWLLGPIADIPREKAQKALENYRQALAEVQLGVTRSECDWEFDRRTEGITLLIPEIQEMRSLARLVALKARLAILDGKRDEAMHWIQTGMVMGRHVSHGPTLIQSLVGIAIDNLMEQCLEDLIQVPGTPSLYWALADRPRPIIDLKEGLEGEYYTLEKEIPSLRELNKGVWSVDRAREFADELQSKVSTFISEGGVPGTIATVPRDLPDAGRRLGIAAICSKVYPVASRTLIAQGFPREQVESMPIVQVTALYSYREYRRLHDHVYKWLKVPYWQSYNRLDAPNMNSAEEKLANPLLTMFRMLEPALHSVRLASVRIERKLDTLQCIEAIRLHAAANGGKLPATLESIQDAPVPFDIATGKPFEYRVDGDSATLSAPVPPGAPNHPAYTIRYLLKLTR